MKLYVVFIDDFSDSELVDYVELISFDQTKESDLVSEFYLLLIYMTCFIQVTVKRVRIHFRFEPE